MKKIIVLSLVIVALLLASGCTQSSPGAATAPTAAATKQPVVTTKTIATAQPTFIAKPTIIQTQTVSVSDNTITIVQLAFDPEVMTVKAGASVRWVNGDTSAHRIKFADGITAQLLSPGQSWTRVFNNPGVFDYTDTINPSMHGTVKVE